jgi:hypothetical protein
MVLTTEVDVANLASYASMEKGRLGRGRYE